MAHADEAPTALILLADGTEEIEFVTPYDVLTRAGFKVQSVGVDLRTGGSRFAICSRNVRIVPDAAIIAMLGRDPTPDVLIIPGGGPGAKTMCADDSVQELVGRLLSRNDGDAKAKRTVVAAICAGTTVVVNAAARVAAETSSSVRKGTVSSHPSVKKEVVDAGWTYSEDRVVVDEQNMLVTSRGPGTALLFALTIVEMVCGKAKRDEVAGPMMCAETL